MGMTTVPTRQDQQTDITQTQSKYNNSLRSRMWPDPSIQNHPAYGTLLQYATAGCPVDCRAPWTREHLEVAVNRGPHSSAKTPMAAKCLREEAREKEWQGQAWIIKWDDIKHAPHKNMKISPLAAVPHKSRTHRAILDLSFQLLLHDERLHSVNDTTTQHAAQISMAQMGKVLPRIIHTIGNADPSKGPIYFAKWDIKDGFWRLVVSEDDAWHFCYVLPKMNPTDPIEIVVPSCLQMGWCESPPFFCTASETARDAAQAFLTQEKQLPPHNLEKYCLPTMECLPKLDNTAITDILRLLEVYMDDFIGLAQAPTHQDLVHFTRAVLHGIHTVFPPPTNMQPEQDEPIAIAKLNKGDGRWATQKEILGWLFDGTTRCINLPKEKIDNIIRSIKDITKAKSVCMGDLEKLNGKLMHTTIGIPNGWGLLSPLIATITAIPKTRHYKSDASASTQLLSKHSKTGKHSSQQLTNTQPLAKTWYQPWPTMAATATPPNTARGEYGLA